MNLRPHYDLHSFEMYLNRFLAWVKSSFREGCRILFQGNSPARIALSRVDLANSSVVPASSNSEVLSALRRQVQEMASAIVRGSAYEKEVHRLEEQSVLREDFVRLLIHDLRSPLATASMAVDMLGEHASSLAEANQLREMAIGNIKRADRMITDLLDASRIRAGENLPLSLEPCSLVSIVNESVKDLTVVHGDRFRLSIEDEGFGRWSIDGLRRVVDNLITNAIKYGAPNAPIGITVRSRDGKFVLRVHNVNRGAPLSLEEQKSIFMKFHRADEAQTGGQKGWGLGLTLVRGIVKAHGGKVAVESHEKSGTTFTVELPAKV